jgi:hypothetical protein
MTGRNKDLRPPRIPPIDSEFINAVNRKAPHLAEPMSLIAKKMNDHINATNLKSSFHRTLLLKDTTVGPDIADRVPIRIAGTDMAVHGVLRKPITKDLAVAIKCYAPSYQGVILKITIPKQTKPSEIVTVSHPVMAAMGEMAVFTFDVITSDGQKDGNGVASFTMEWA